MLVEFSVENYRSFKDKITFSMLASDDTEHEDTNIITLPNGKRLLKSAAIYGANASGKTNLMLAMNYMASLVCTSQHMKPDESIITIPFKLDNDCLFKPCKFDVIFYCDGVKYAYGFAATGKEVIEEYLYSFFNDNQRIIFHRSNDNENEFNFSENEEKDKGVFDFLRDFNAPNKLFLSTAGAYNKLVNVYRWFFDLYLYTSRIPYQLLRNSFFEENSDIEKVQDYVNKAIQWTTEIDVGINELSLNADPQLFSGEFTWGDENHWDKYVKILKNMRTTHKVTSIEGTSVSADFNMYEESGGTERFFSVALAVAEKMSRGAIFLADELNNSLHTHLMKHIVGLFHAAESNPFNSQLIFTTHDTNLLDLDIFRRDQIWFLEKKPDSGATDILSLHDFEIPEHARDKKVNIEKGYHLGIYGAIPYIRGNIYG